MLHKLGFGLLCILAASAGLWFSLSLRSDFSTLEGDELRWQDLHGNIVIVNYFAEWCAPCLKEIPELNEFAAFTDTHPSVDLFAVNFDNLSDQQLIALKNKYNMTFAMISGLPKNAPFAMPKSLPATFIVGVDGKLIKQLNGEQTNVKLQSIVATLQSSQGL